mgnify:CR=1 FL=1
MVADFYITKVSNDMKIAVQKNHLGGQILYRSLDPVKKRRQRVFNFFLRRQKVGMMRNYRVRRKGPIWPQSEF